VIQNAGFETAETALDAGVAKFWAATSLGTGEESAAFAGDTGAAPQAHETFDHGWGFFDPQRIRVSMALTEIESLPAETMNAWVVNQLVMELTALEAATFDGHTLAIENFELWMTMIDTDFHFSDGELQSGIVESFDWHTLTASMPATFGALFSGFDSEERFPALPPQKVFGHMSSNAFVRVDGGNFVGTANDIVTLETDGELPPPYVAGASYYVQVVWLATVQLGGAPVSPTSTTLGMYDNGSGIHRIIGDPRRYWVTDLI
jgi:hypothetical protein